MASIIAGGLLNAVAFSAAGLLFSKLIHRDYELEIKRHTLALEKLQSAREKFYENELEKKDEIMKLRQQLEEANNDINLTNKALDELKRVRTKCGLVGRYRYQENFVPKIWMNKKSEHNAINGLRKFVEDM